MNCWDLYQSRLDSTGTSKRDTWLQRTQRYLSMKEPDNLAFHTVDIDGTPQQISVASTGNMNEKLICSLPGETIIPGATISWRDQKWLVTETDASNEVYARAKMVQCNYLLKWVAHDPGTGEVAVYEQWCIIEDGTKYMTGEYEDRDFVVTRGDSRIVMTIAKNDRTTRFKRGCRFLIDDMESDPVLAYELTKPFKLGKIYNNQGVFKFLLQEVTTTDDDNTGLLVADYYRYFPREDTGVPTPGLTIDPENRTTEDGRQVWL